MSYKVGDKFEIEIAEVLESSRPLYRIKGFSSLVFDDFGIGQLKKIEPEPEYVDWSKVEVDTPILVKFSEDEKWTRRHFAKFEFGKVCAWMDGATSWSADGLVQWNYAKLVEKGGKE